MSVAGRDAATTVPVAGPGGGGVPPLERWVCDGRRKDGGPCRRVLMELWLAQGRVVIRCPYCGTWHTRQGAGEPVALGSA